MSNGASTNAEPKKDDEPKGVIASIGMGGGLLAVFFVLILASGAAIIKFPEQLGKFAYLVPIVFLFIAIGAFLLLLEHYAYTLQKLKPELPVTALGLPEGSVRAFLTIGLLTLVAVFGTFLYFESGKSEYPLVRSNVSVATAEQLQALRKEVGDRFLVIPRFNQDGVVAADVVSATPDTSRSDIAKQLLTMITTVLTTVIGFYFGSRTTEESTAPRTAPTRTPSPTAPAPQTGSPSSSTTTVRPAGP
jgi:hypothetical protein